MKEKELYVHMGFYLTMNEDETKDEALARFYKIISESKVDHESSIVIYGIEEQEC